MTQTKIQPNVIDLAKDFDFTGALKKNSVSVATMNDLIPGATGAQGPQGPQGLVGPAGPVGSATVTTLVPRGTFASGGVTNFTAVTNTTLRMGLINIPFDIIVNKITIRSAGATVAGTLKLAMYSEDGGGKMFEVTTATINGAMTITTAVPSVTLAAGNYWICLLPVGTLSATINCWNDTLSTLDSGISGEPVTSGTITVTADTMPTSFNPVSGITAVNNVVPIIRLDN